MNLVFNLVTNLAPNLVLNLVPNLAPNLVHNLVPNLVPNLAPNLVPNLVPNLTPNRAQLIFREFHLNCGRMMAAFAAEVNKKVAFPTGVEPVFSAPFTIKEVEALLGYGNTNLILL